MGRMFFDLLKYYKSNQKKIKVVLIILLFTFVDLQLHSCRSNKNNTFNSSGITQITLNQKRIDDLIILGKVWGYLKYYHPVVARGKINWDKELFRILPKIIDSKNLMDRNEILSDWIVSLGKFKIGTNDAFDSSEVKLYPDLKWIEDTSNLGKILSVDLNQIKNANRNGNNFYVGLRPAGNPTFDNEDPLPNLKYPDAGYRLLALFRYWNIIQYFFPYKNLIDNGWDIKLREFIPKFIAASNELQYKLNVLALIASIHDSHAQIYNSDSTITNYFGKNLAPFGVSFIEDKPVVINYFDKIDTMIKKGSTNPSLLLTNKSSMKIGDVILSINNKAQEEFVKEKLPITSASNYPTQLRNISQILMRTNDSILIIEYQRGNSIYSARILSFPRNELNRLQFFQHRDTCFKLIEPKVGYIYLPYFRNIYVDRIAFEIRKTNALIIDLRFTPNENAIWTLMPEFFFESKNFVKGTTCSIKTPGLFTFFENNNDTKVGGYNPNYYKGKIIILVNEMTQSSMEFTTMALKSSTNAIVIGSTTSGADGNVSYIYLPGGIKTAISGIGIYYPDGRETQRIGIVPDIEVKPTIKGIKEGRDELIEKALEVIRDSEMQNK